MVYYDTSRAKIFHRDVNILLFMQLLIVYMKTAQKGDLVIISDKILSFNTKLYLRVFYVVL